MAIREQARVVRLLALASAVACPVFLAGLHFDSIALRLPAKPWIHLLLIAWVVSSSTGAYARRIATAIGICMVADVTLEFRHSHFVHGMALFLAGQLALASAFTMRCRRLRAGAALPFVVWLGAALVVIWPGLGGLRAPVLAYMAAIGVMMWRAGAWAASSGSAIEAPSADAERAASRQALAGAVVFGVSDTMIALDRFHAPLPGARYWIILTYWAALALLAWSAVRAERRA